MTEVNESKMDGGFSKKIDYLVEDALLSNQSWVCISFLSPEGIRNCKIRGIKVRGVYATKDEADTRAKELQKVDPDFHVFVGEVGKWLGWDPDPNSIDDQQYREDELNKLMFNYKKNLEKTKLMEQERKNTMIDDAMKTEKENKTRERLRKKHKNKNNSSNVEQPVKVTSDELKEKAKLVEEKVDKLKEKEQDVKQSETKLLELDESLAKIEKLYASINKKKSNVGALPDSA